MKITDSESSNLLSPESLIPPKDSFHLAYVVYFTLGAGYHLPWNAFITVVDYFTYLYPDAIVDRVFSVVYMLVGLVCLFLIIFYAHVSEAYARINAGLAIFVLSLLIVPVMDVVYIKGQVGLYFGFYVTVGAVALSGLGDALVQGGVVGNAGEMPERYMQSTIAGSSASGVLVSLLRVFMKAVYTQDESGLRKSANLYFIVSIVIMLICIIFYNFAHRLPIVKYCKDLKAQAVIEEKEEKGSLTGPLWIATLWDIFGRVKWYGFGVLIVYVVTLSIFPGYITEDVHSQVLRDWYPILLISCYNVFDLVGKSLTAACVIENAKIAIGSSCTRLLFFPLFYACLQGPKFFRTEIPVMLLTCLLGLTNGYMTSVLFMLVPRVVQLQNAETAGILIVLFLFLGLAVGSIVSWFWVI